MSSNGAARYYGTVVAAGSLVMALLVVGLVLYVGQLVDQVETLETTVAGHETTIKTLAGLIDQQNRAIVDLGGQRVPVPVPLPHEQGTTAPATTTTTTTTVAAPPPATTTTTAPPSPTTTTTTTTVPCDVEVLGQCVSGG